ncbi:MAG: hypothetical protein XE08_0759, partial [Parcubacteria bacterium 32_520]
DLEVQSDKLGNKLDSEVKIYSKAS